MTRAVHTPADALEGLRQAYSQARRIQERARRHCVQHSVPVPYWATQRSVPECTPNEYSRVLTTIATITVTKPRSEWTQIERRVLDSLSTTFSPHTT